MPKTQNILIAPLDWGLGHATRCIPVIKHLSACGFAVFVASSNAPKALLQKEFPTFSFIHLPGYNVQYSRYKRFLPIKILLQAKKIFSAIKKEEEILENIIAEYNINLVISDNRYGFVSQKIPSVFITHQLLIDAPYKWLEHLIQKINYRYINKFTECWVPDFEARINLSGKLSHPSSLPSVPLKYIGPLSRFSVVKNEEIKYTFLAILSGPEPQRTLLEEKILKTFSLLKDEKILVVRGMPEIENKISSSSNITIYNHLDTDELQVVISQSEFIISRCGYTTVMEMLSLKKKTIFIPTPGQTEQEYLASHLMQQQWAFCCKQNDDLQEKISSASKFNYSFPELNYENYKHIITESIEKLLS